MSDWTTESEMEDRVERTARKIVDNIAFSVDNANWYPEDSSKYNHFALGVITKVCDTLTRHYKLVWDPHPGITILGVDEFMDKAIDECIDEFVDEMGCD